ncbi:MAG: NFACT RNA binding domain-containing protein [Sellimonas sp.]|uniref:Rqc2 family fibronectin-binding protein n=1 Tax=Oscillospiraceae TaxID=216572 RepID=UPI0011071D2A|nr:MULTISPECIES: NFACT RNA binding domain-containing protein [Oscillospiraceae]MEE0781664.1 NFACT RNA binding domain-containing protein [Sellimonas sp.]
MALDGITIANIVKEMRDALLGGRIAKIAQPEADELLLTVKAPSGQRRLYISASASLPLVYLTDENKPSPFTAPNFCMLLRKHIANGRIVSITQPSLERIIVLGIEHLDELGDLCRKKLVIEIMGKHSNVIFCDEDDRIIDSIKHVPAQMSSVREVLPGRTYFIPDTMHKADPLTISESDFAALLRQKPSALSKALYTSLTGISPVVAEEICFLAGLDSALPPSELSDDLMTHLYRQFSLFLDQVREEDFHPAIYYRNNEPQEFASVPLTHLEGCARQEFDTISQVLSSYYAVKNRITRIRQKSADLRHIVQTALERNRKKYDLQARQLKDTDKRETYKVYGELLQTYGYQAEPEAKELEALNYYTNEMIRIPLDPTKTPLENAKRYFEKYNKMKRTYEALSHLIVETRDEISYLESVSNALDIARTEDDLAQVKEELTQSGYVRRKFTKKKEKFKSMPLHYISSDGYDMYVGKNNFQNEELTFSFASGNDWWFHAKKVPGSHVIVKSQGEDMPDRVFEEAGKLAAFYSKNNGSEKVEVDYVEKKHVKKVKGQKPGFVIYHTNYSLIADTDISMLKEVSES